MTLVVRYQQELYSLARVKNLLPPPPELQNEPKPRVRKPRAAKPPPEPKPMWRLAVEAAEEKQAKDLKVLDLREVTTFADYFIICSGGNTKQNQAIANEIQSTLKQQGEYANSMEGYENAEWILMDYGDYLIHIFSESARTYYDLERLWRDAKVVKT